MRTPRSFFAGFFLSAFLLSTAMLMGAAAAGKFSIWIPITMVHALVGFVWSVLNEERGP